MVGSSKKFYYFDSSVLLKRYFEEKGSLNIARLFEQPHFILTASITYAECYSAMNRL